MSARLSSVLLLSLTALPLAAQANPSTPPPFKPFTEAETTSYMELGRNVTRWFLEGHADSIWAVTGPEMQGAIGGIEGIHSQMDRIADRAGIALQVLDEKMTRRNGHPQFWFEAVFSNFTDEPLVFRWVFNDKGEIVGAGMGPKSQAQSDPED